MLPIRRLLRILPGQFSTLKPSSFQNSCLNKNVAAASVVQCRQKHHRGKKDPCDPCPKSLFDCNCKVAVIAGGATGIGLAFAHEILNGKARNVALLGTNNCAGRESVNILNCAYGKERAVFFNADVQSNIQMTECFDKIMKEFGHIDLVVNGAGIFDGAKWEQEILTNFVGTVRGTLLGYKHMSRDACGGRGGVILNISGLYGLKSLNVAPTLCAEQHGIIGLSRSFGHERNEKRTGIRVVTLCPGITDTYFIQEADKRALNSDLGKGMTQWLTKVKRQKSEVCGKAAMHVLKYGRSGSIWVVDGSNLYSCTLPKWTQISKLESQLI